MAGTVVGVITQRAFRVRGATVHAVAACVTSRTSPIVLRGAQLPVRPDGVVETWRPCLTCGTSLVETLIHAHRGHGDPWLLWLPADLEDRSWQVAQRPRKVELLRAIASACGAVTVPARDPDAAPVVAARLPTDVVAVVDGLVVARPLPAEALDAAAADPAGFADVAGVFAKITYQAPRPDADPCLPARSPAVAAWASDHWTAAHAITAPAAC